MPTDDELEIPEFLRRKPGEIQSPEAHAAAIRKLGWDKLEPTAAGWAPPKPTLSESEAEYLRAQAEAERIRKHNRFAKLRERTTDQSDPLVAEGGRLVRLSVVMARRKRRYNQALLEYARWKGLPLPEIQSADTVTPPHRRPRRKKRPVARRTRRNPVNKSRVERAPRDPNAPRQMRTRKGKDPAAKLIKPVPRGGTLGKVVGWLLANPGRPLAEVCKATDRTDQLMSAHLVVMHRTHGLGYRWDGDAITVLLPAGCTDPLA